ncbi:MAG: WD40/YVTN/BNR-like repeat-containing protein, partial [Thiohalomonadales bacterium]
WSVDDESNATVRENGDFIGLKEATVKVTAEDSKGRIGGATIVITDEEVLSISITPRSATIVSGDATTYTVTTALSNKTSADITRQASWVTDDPANISFPDPSGTVKSKRGFVGESVITVSFRDKTATTILTVEAPKIFVSAVDDATSVAIGTTLQMAASGNVSRNCENVSGNYSWSVGDSTISSIDNTGLLSILPTATTSEIVKVTAADVDNPNCSGTITISIDPAVLQSIVMTPSTKQVVSTGNSIQYSVLGNYSNQTSGDITDQVAWSSNKPDAVIFGSGESIGTVTAQAGFPGRVDIETSLADVVISSTLTILQTMWEPMNTGLNGGNVISIAYHPTDSAILYVGVAFGGVYKSIDGGATWNAFNVGIEFESVYSLAIVSDTSSTTVYAVTSGAVYNSIDGGKTWVNTTTTITPTLSYTAVRLNPVNSAVFVGSNAGVYESSDAGQSWNRLVINAADSLAVDPIVEDLLIDSSTTPATLYVSGLSKLYKGKLDGTPLAEVTVLGLSSSMITTLSLSMDPINPGTLYAGTENGLVESTDGGVNWIGISDPVLINSAISNFTIDPNAPNTFYLTTVCTMIKCSIYKSIDAGTSWTEISMGPVPSRWSNKISVDPSTAGKLYFLTNQGIRRSIDGGVNWTHQDVGIANTHVSTLQFDPSTPTTLFAGTRYNGVFKSIDKGLNWTSINGDLTSMNVKSLEIDPVTPDTYYAVGDGYSVVKSTDGGGTWSRADVGLENAGQVSVIAIDSNTPSTIYVGAKTGVFKSIDNGVSWLSQSAGITVGANKRSITALLIDPASPETVYAGSESNGVFKSIDGGGSWRVINIGILNLKVSDLRLDLETPTTVYAQTSGRGIFKSVNGGESWSVSDTGYTASSFFEILEISPTSPNILYRGNYFGSFAISINGGNTWTDLHTPFFKFPITSMSVAPLDPSVLYVGTNKVGVYKVTTAGIQ